MSPLKFTGVITETGPAVPLSPWVVMVIALEHFPATAVEGPASERIAGVLATASVPAVMTFEGSLALKVSDSALLSLKYKVFVLDPLVNVIEPLTADPAQALLAYKPPAPNPLRLTGVFAVALAGLPAVSCN